jgi:hypothetical protein
MEGQPGKNFGRGKKVPDERNVWLGDKKTEGKEEHENSNK